MIMADIFDNLDQVMGDLFARLVEQGLEGTMHDCEFRVVRTRAVNEHYDIANYEVSTMISTAGGLLIEVATSFSDLAEWPENIQMMTDNLFDAICSIAEQAEEIETRGAVLQIAAATAIANAEETALINYVSVTPHRLFVPGSIHRGVNAEVDFNVTMTMLGLDLQIGVVAERFTDADEFDAHFEQYILPEQQRRTAKLEAENIARANC